jgi:hypothetical protein
MLLRPATCNCGRNIDPLFRIVAAKFQDAKFRALPHSGSGNGPLPLLRVQLRPLPPLFISLGWTDSGDWRTRSCCPRLLAAFLATSCPSTNLWPSWGEVWGSLSYYRGSQISSGPCPLTSRPWRWRLQLWVVGKGWHIRVSSHGHQFCKFAWIDDGIVCIITYICFTEFIYVVIEQMHAKVHFFFAYFGI